MIGIIQEMYKHPDVIHAKNHLGRQRRSERLFELILVFQSGILACVILGCFVNFLENPYYEPLQLFMIIFLF